jgi:hypothetical protein
MKQTLFLLAGAAILAGSTSFAHAQAQQQPAPQTQPAPQYQQQPQTQPNQTQYQQAPQQAAQPQYQQQCPPVYQGPPPNPEGPMVNIGRRHGNLRQAQGFLVESYEAIQQAQASNDYELGGHAQRAIDLISQAAEELRLAANVSNREGH